MTLSDVLREKGLPLINNMERVLVTAKLDAVLYEMPIWRHIYHTLYWFDRWFSGPARFTGADFHKTDMESLDIPSNLEISMEELQKYCHKLVMKSREYLLELTDEMLYEEPEGADTNRLGLILSQFRHAYYHLGVINCTTIERTGEWPFVAGKPGDEEKGLFE